MITSIPLSKLVPSQRNVRRRSDAHADEQLKAGIAACGLLQNLVVTPTKKPKGHYTVEAGGRRLAALRALAAEGLIAADHEVACLVLDRAGSDARETSLAENIQRLAMNPAEECLAFGKLMEEGADVEGVARRFGLTVRFVEGRLRLASLAPEIFEALGAGEISLDVAKAYAASGDRDRQSWVFAQLQGSYSGNHPDSIRRMMTQASVSATDRRAILVGAEAYVAAGGRIERDLFDEASGERWLDVPLLEQLATEKMEGLAHAKAAELGIAWVRPTLEPWLSWSITAGLRRVVPSREPLTAEEEAQIAAKDSELEQLFLIIEDDDSSDEQLLEAETRSEELRREIAAPEDKPFILDEQVKPTLGTFLLLGHDGQPQLADCFYAQEASAEAGEERLGAETKSAHEGQVSPPSEPGTKPLSRALVDELAIQRRDILAAHVAGEPALAQDLATFLMIDREAVLTSEPSGSTLAAIAPTDPVFGFESPDARATLARKERSEKLDRSWVAGRNRSERFLAFRALPSEARSAWLAHAVARTVEARANVAGSRRCFLHETIGSLIGIEVAAWWRPTGANYFDRVPKAVTLSALEEVGGSAFATRYAGMKKAELASEAERIFAGTAIIEAEVKERALAWVPEAMRFASAEPLPVRDDDTPPWEEDPEPTDATLDAMAEEETDDGGGTRVAGAGELDQAA